MIQLLSAMCWENDVRHKIIRNVPNFGTINTLEANKMKVITVWNMKGGVGKTTTVINLAYNFSVEGYRVLVLDLDPQVNCTPVFVDITGKNKTIRNVLEKGCITGSYIYRSRYKKIDIIKGDIELTEIFAPDILKTALIDVKDVYDIVLIDCRPVFESLTQNAVLASDLILTPAILDRFCLDNLKLVKKLLSRADIHAEWYIFANRIRNVKSQMKIYQEVVGKNEYPFLNTCINDRAAVPNAIAYRKPVMLHQGGSAASRDFIQLAYEVRGIIYG